MPFPNKDSQFHKGVSGNPSGRRKGKSISTYLQEFLNYKVPKSMLEEAKKGGRAIKGLDGREFHGTYSALITAKIIQKALKGDPRAITEVLDRVEGKAMQHITQESTNTNYNLDNLNDQDLDRLIGKYEEKTNNN